MGLPFCGFKLLTGVALLASDVNGLPLLGRALIALGLLDAGINLINLGGLLVLRRRPFDACTLGLLSRLALRRSADAEDAWAWQDLGNSLDVLLSMTLVAVVIAAGLLHNLNPAELLAWNLCVICNVMGAGLGRLGSSLRKQQLRRRDAKGSQ